MWINGRVFDEVWMKVRSTGSHGIDNIAEAQTGNVAADTVVSEILVPRVCGCSKIAQIHKIHKMLFSFELPLSTFKRLQILSNELSEIGAGRLAIVPKRTLRASA